jgi:DNA replication protein DnaC
MLMQPTLDKLSDLRLPGLRHALAEQMANPQYAELLFEERVSLLVDQEWLRRQDVRLKRRLAQAHFREHASIEDLDFAPERGLNRSQVMQLTSGDWIVRHLNLVVCGATGVGKTFLACALGRAACKAGFSVRYERLSTLLLRIRQAHAQETWADLLRDLDRIDLLVVDDWLRDPVTVAQARDLAEILDDRYRRASTLLATQVPVSEWHGRLGGQDAADGILDRFIHNAYRLDLKGDSQRKLRSPLPIPNTTESPS